MVVVVEDRQVGEGCAQRGGPAKYTFCLLTAAALGRATTRAVGPTGYTTVYHLVVTTDKWSKCIIEGAGGGCHGTITVSAVRWVRCRGAGLLARRRGSHADSILGPPDVSIFITEYRVHWLISLQFGATVPQTMHAAAQGRWRPP